MPAAPPGDAQQRQHANAAQAQPRPQQLARQGGGGVGPAWPRAQPLAQRAVAQFAAHAPGACRHGQDVQQRRDQRRAQELLVVGGHVEQRDHLRLHRFELGQRSGGALAPLVAHRQLDARRDRADHGLDIALHHARVAAQLRVVPQHHLRSLAGFGLARQLARNGDHGIDLGRAQGLLGLGGAGVLRGHAQTGRRTQHARELASRRALWTIEFIAASA